MSLGQVTLIYYGAIVLLIIIVAAAYPGWKTVPLALLWPVIGLGIVLMLMFGWFFKDVEKR